MISPPQEKVAIFGEERGLVGIVTTPSGTPANAPHVILLNAGIIHRVGPNRLSVNMARALGAVGVTSLRFDYSGIGDSDRHREVLSLRESVERDLASAMAYLAESHGATRFVLMGLCSGAFDALHAAMAHPQVVGVIMVDLVGAFRGWGHTFHHLRARILRPESWRNPLSKLLHHSRHLVDPAPDEPQPDPVYVVGGRSTPTRAWMEEQFGALLARDVRLCFIFTAGIEANYNHRSQFRRAFPRAARHPAVSLDFFPDADHAFSTSDSRARLADMVVRWVVSEPFGERVT